MVSDVDPDGPAAAFLRQGDVIIQFNGRPIKNNDELVRMVVATKPGTNVPVKVLRNKQEKTLTLTVDELDLDAEQNPTTRRSTQNDQDPPEEHGAGGFGLTLENVTPQLARRLRLPSGHTGAVVSDVDPDGPSAAFLRQGDVILSVNSRPVPTAADAARELGTIEAGHIAQMRVWRGDGEVFVPVRKE